VLAIGGSLNGPVIGAILTIVGFSAYGKHPRNIAPIILGVFVGSLLKPWGAADPSATLAALFGTTLAPIAGRFGWGWGIVAGFVHSSAAMCVGPLHAGLNLYNNGFAAIIAASVLVPVILAVRAGFGYDDGDVKTEQHAFDEVDQPKRALRQQLDRRNHGGRGQALAGETGESVGRKQQDPGDDDKGKRQRRDAKGLQRIRGAERRHHRYGGAENDIDPEQGTRRNERCEREPDERAVIAVETGVQRRPVDPEPKRRERRRHHGYHPGDEDLWRTRRKRPPGDRSEEQEPSQRIVLEHDLPDAAQVDVDEAQEGEDVQSASHCSKNFFMFPPSNFSAAERLHNAPLNATRSVRDRIGNVPR
jgi:hypothetical protein